MKKTLLVCLIAIGLVHLLFSEIEASDRSRLIVLADMGHDPDEEQQMTHLLMCSNEVEIEGLIVATGRFLRPNPKNSVKWLRPHLFHQLIDAYEIVYPNLQRHATGWQDPKHLRRIVANGQTGNGMMDVGEGRWSRGSRLITEAVMREDPRPLHIIVNAGANTLAQALFEYRASHSAKEVDAFVAKLRVFENAGQDEAGVWICHEFPDIHWIRSVYQTPSYGGPENSKLGPHTWEPFAYSGQGQHDWAKEHVQTNHGPLGALYPDRRVGKTVHFIEGGGTIPFMRFVSRGLTDPTEPSWGGWSGRYSIEKVANVPSLYKILRPDELAYRPYAFFTDAELAPDRWVDPDGGKVYSDVYTSVWRWRWAMWNDFQARMDWCVQPFEKANHHPHAVINGDSSDEVLRLSAKTGDVLEFDANGSTDPDEDLLRFSWWIYPEAGDRPYGRDLSIDDSMEASVSLRVPADAVGKELHLILEVWDESEIAALVDYRRAVISVTE